MAVDASDLTRAIEDWADRVHIEAVNTLEERLRTRLADAINPSGESTGALAASYERTDGERTSEIAYTAEHASFLDQGTGPHRIEGNPLLAFEMGGETVIVHYVDHPGTEATFFWTDIMEDDGAYEQALEAAAAQVGFD